MWIHVPSLASVQDTEELNLDSRQLSLLEQFATWKTKSVSQRSWLHVWKTEPSIRLLYGLTLEPSTLNRGATKWISSLEDSPVNHTQLPGNKREKTTQGNSAEKSSELPKDLGTQLSFSKMFLESLDTTGIPYDPNYERWVMKLRKDYSQRQKQAHLINDSDSSSWPTASARDYKGNEGTVTFKNGRFVRTSNTTGTEYGGTLDGAVVNWRTPSSSETEGGIKDFDRKIGLGGQPAQHKLRDQVAAWPTPNTMDVLPPRSQEGTKKLFEGQRKGRTSPSNLREFVHPENWPTPTTQEIKHNDMKFTETGRRETKDGKDSHSLNLQDVSAEWTKEKEIWPTPRVSSANGPSQSELEQGNPKRRLETEVPLWTPPNKEKEIWATSIHPTQANEKNGHSCSPKCRRLNPLFAEMLMGLCQGWTDASEPLGMEWFRRWQQLLGSTLQRNLQE